MKVDALSKDIGGDQYTYVVPLIFASSRIIVGLDHAAGGGFVERLTGILPSAAGIGHDFSWELGFQFAIKIISCFARLRKYDDFFTLQ